MRKERKVVLRFYLLLFTKKWKPEKKKKKTPVNLVVGMGRRKCIDIQTFIYAEMACGDMLGSPAVCTAVCISLAHMLVHRGIYSGLSIGGIHRTHQRLSAP